MANATVERKLLGLERKYWQAIKNKDVEAAMALSDDPCIVAGAQGVATIDRATMGKMMQSGSYTLDEFELMSGAQVRMLGDDIALVAYKVHEKLTVDGKPVELDASDCSTWVKRDGKWLCAMHAEALAGDPFGRDRRAS
jgi:ketosteroid isomerase-like protein